MGSEDQENNGTSRSSVFSVSGSGPAPASSHFSPLADDKGFKTPTTSTWFAQTSAATSNGNRNLNQSSDSNLNLVSSSQNQNANSSNNLETTAHLLEELPTSAISNKQQEQRVIGSNSICYSSSNADDETVCSTFKIDPSSLPAVSSSPTKKTGSFSSPRAKIAAYLASKLYNLTNLASGGNVGPNSFSSTNNSNNNNNIQLQQQQPNPLLARNSMSAPPSPLNKRGSSASKRQPLRSSCVCYRPDQLPFYLSKDYGGCDFILFVESTSKPLMMSMSSSVANHHHSKGASQSHHQHGISHHHHHATNVVSDNHAGNVASGSHSNSANRSLSSAMGILHQSGNSSASCGSGAGPIIIHLIAPNLQEKAAWMSDISQVSSSSSGTKGSLCDELPNSSFRLTSNLFCFSVLTRVQCLIPSIVCW